MSLLFRPRLPSEGISPAAQKPKDAKDKELKDTIDDGMELFHQHIQLCDRVLQHHYLAAVRRDSGCYSKETWVVLLKVLLGICDNLLVKPPTYKPQMTLVKPAVNPNDIDQLTVLMGDKLSESLIKVISVILILYQTIFEIWLASKTMRIDMWDTFQHHFQKWTWRNPMIKEWCTVSMSLSSYIISDLVVKTPSIRSLSKGATSIIISEHDLFSSAQFNPSLVLNGENSLSLESVRDQMYYCWHRVICTKLYNNRYDSISDSIGSSKFPVCRHGNIKTS